VLEAVMQNGLALEFAAEELRSDRDNISLLKGILP